MRLRSVADTVARLGTLMGYAAGWGFILCAAFITFDVLARRFSGLVAGDNGDSPATRSPSVSPGRWRRAHPRAHIRIDVLINHLPDRAARAAAPPQPSGARGVHRLHRQGRLRPG